MGICQGFTDPTLRPDDGNDLRTTVPWEPSYSSLAGQPAPMH